MTEPSARIARHRLISERLRHLDDHDLAALVDGATPLGSGIGGRTALLHLDGLPVFVKRIPLTDLERQPANVRSTANLFHLPTFYQYGVGSTGFGAWRELAAHEITTAWVLDGKCASFPLTHHWRVLPHEPIDAPPGNEIESMVAYWDNSPAVQNRLKAIAAASASVVLFLEYVPHTLHSWLLTHFPNTPETPALANDATPTADPAPETPAPLETNAAQEANPLLRPHPASKTRAVIKTINALEANPLLGAGTALKTQTVLTTSATLDADPDLRADAAPEADTAFKIRAAPETNATPRTGPALEAGTAVKAQAELTADAALEAGPALRADGAGRTQAVLEMVDRELHTGVEFMRAHGMVHFDAHPGNVLTDGRQLFFADLGLALHDSFELSDAETSFLRGNADFDGRDVERYFVNWLVSHLRPEDGQAALRNDCIAGSPPADIPARAAEIIGRYGRTAELMNDFYAKLVAGPKDRAVQWNA